MKITKYGHSCLLIEENGVRIITDPGIWNTTPDATGVSAVLITHEHPDHSDVEQVKAILGRNPEAQVITHKGLGSKLEEAGIAYTEIKAGETIDVQGVSVESCGTDHAIIYGDASPCQNTGYLIAGKLFAPGDALHDVPPGQIEILALPCGGPWMRFSDAIDYAKSLKPRVVFPIHDAMYIEEFRGGLVPRVIGGSLESAGISFIDMPAGATKEF